MKTVVVEMERRMAPLKDVVSLVRLIRVCAKERPYMVHSMTPKAGMLCMLAAWLTRVPRRVHTFTGLVWPTTKGMARRILMFTDWLTCVCATHVLPEGRGVMEDLRQVTRKPMRVLGYGNVRGVDMEMFSRRPEVMARAAELRKEGVFTFLFVGRLVGDKGINELVEAFARLYEEWGERVRLVLVGPYEPQLDPLRPEAERLIDALPSIEVVGAKSGDELRAWYAAADVFVFPSYREGFPNVVLEAGAMGLPSIVTDINGSREIIEEGKNGTIIPIKSSEAIYAAMKRMLQHPEETAKWVANARSLIACRFERSFVQQCLYDFYRDL